MVVVWGECGGLSATKNIDTAIRKMLLREIKIAKPDFGGKDCKTYLDTTVLRTLACHTVCTRPLLWSSLLACPLPDPEWPAARRSVWPSVRQESLNALEGHNLLEALGGLGGYTSCGVLLHKLVNELEAEASELEVTQVRTVTSLPNASRGDIVLPSVEECTSTCSS